MNEEMKKAIYKLRDDLATSNPDFSTVSVVRSDLVALLNGLFYTEDEWSNQSALGYAISAAERAGMSDEGIGDLVAAMRSEFDLQTLESAANVYRESDY